MDVKLPKKNKDVFVPKYAPMLNWSNLLSPHLYQVTAELEETHKQEMEASNTSLQAELDSDFIQRLQALQTQLQEATQQLQESDQQHEDEMTSLKQSLEMKLAQMEEDHADQLAALGSSQDADVETAKGDLEEVHRKEIIDLQNKLEAQKQKGR